MREESTTAAAAHHHTSVKTLDTETGLDLARHSQICARPVLILCFTVLLSRLELVTFQDGGAGNVLKLNFWTFVVCRLSSSVVLFSSLLSKTFSFHSFCYALYVLRRQ